MRNFIQPGDTVTLPAPYTVNSGDGLLVGTIFGVASGNADNGKEVEAVTIGVFDLKKKATDVIAIGAALYWDNTAKEVTVTAEDNTLIGSALLAAGNGVTIVRVRLPGVTSPGPAGA
jgi:predicted RecA/RadA family phage recombinase